MLYRKIYKLRVRFCEEFAPDFLTPGPARAPAILQCRGKEFGGKFLAKSNSQFLTLSVQHSNQFAD